MEAPVVDPNAPPQSADGTPASQQRHPPGSHDQQGRDRGRRNRSRRDGTPGSVIPVRPPSGVHKVLLLNASSPGEIRVAVLENNELAEIFIERKSQRQVTGNIYKARVANVEASLQAGFIDLGTPRNGFLHVSDCLPPGENCVGDKPQPETSSPQHVSPPPVPPRPIDAPSPVPATEIPAAEVQPVEPGQALPGSSSELPVQAAVAPDGTVPPARKGRRRASGQGRPPGQAIIETMRRLCGRRAARTWPTPRDRLSAW
jgi:hypothetical protein